DKDILKISPYEETELEHAIYEFDKIYGFQYPIDISDLYSFDIRRFLNNATNEWGFPVRLATHPRAGFFLSSDIVKPKFSFTHGIEISMRNLNNGKIDLNLFFDSIFNKVRFYRETEWLIERYKHVLNETETSFWDDKFNKLNISESMDQRNWRRDINYEASKILGKHLRVYRKELIENNQMMEVEKLFDKAKMLARENTLFFLPLEAGTYIIQKEWIRCAYPKGEEFMFFCLHRSIPFYYAPYQITYSITPPSHEQVIHGHLKTEELTISLGRGMFYKSFKFKNGEIIGKKRVEVNQYIGTGYGMNTPHLIGNAGDKPCKNVTIKYNEAILDRWDLDESPDESEYTYISDLVYPAIKEESDVVSYLFEKEKVSIKIITIPPNQKFTISLEMNEEKGLFLVEGKPIIWDGYSFYSPDECTIIYFIAGEYYQTFTINNNDNSNVILVGVDLKEKSLKIFEKVTKSKFKALLLDIDNVITDPFSKTIVPQVLDKLIDILEKRIPVCFVSGRTYSTRQESKINGFKDIKEIVDNFLFQLQERNQEYLLPLLFFSSENGAVINTLVNGFKYETGVPLETLNSENQKRIIKALELCGLMKEVTIEEKQHSVGLINISEGNFEKIRDLIISKLSKMNLFNKVDIIKSGNSLFLYPKGTNKKLALDFLMRHFKIKEEEIAAFGDNGELGGMDHIILNRFGGFSVGSYDENSDYMINIPEISGCEKGYHSLLWTLNILNFISPETCNFSNSLERAN
ncbi:HAD superfamily hydrolase-like, type 3 domain protein, partial [Candidatus Magnetomorum sp. HK-1]